ncbi:unnamed protein product [Spirodela intermedia]|uniref:Uncharacterized protein n=1 Tax=Spirodela intermedia TaxID=51605 RepID=A0A7I8IJ49_SPIIN|nr:unnamed protein product [Spirodela intermedia]CAA6657925.1 unnamed protein product [Spirodela intermedia]
MAAASFSPPAAGAAGGPPCRPAPRGLQLRRLGLAGGFPRPETRRRRASSPTPHAIVPKK